MIPMYNVQQPVEESVSFSLEARIRYDGVVAGHEGERDIVVVGSLRRMSTSCARCGWVITYPGVDHAWRLDQDHLLEELDAAYPYAWCGAIHASQDGGLDRRHELPIVGIVRVRDTGAHSSMRECST